MSNDNDSVDYRKSVKELKAALAKSRAKREARREEKKRSERFRKMYRCNTG